MRRRSKRASAVVAVLGLLAPWAQGVAVAAHLLADYGHEAAAHVVELEVLVHGHSHTESTPAHSHAFAAASPMLKAGPPPALPHLHPAWPLIPVAAAQPELGGSAARSLDGRCGLGPPASSRLFPILRI